MTLYEYKFLTAGSHLNDVTIKYPDGQILIREGWVNMLLNQLNKENSDNPWEFYTFSLRCASSVIGGIYSPEGYTICFRRIKKS